MIPAISRAGVIALVCALCDLPKVSRQPSTVYLLIITLASVYSELLVAANQQELSMDLTPIAHSQVGQKLGSTELPKLALG